MTNKPQHTKPASPKRVSRFHAQNPADAAWRAQQAQVDADIEGLSRDAAADQLIVEMDARGIEPRKQIERLKAYFRSRRNTHTIGGS